MSGTVGLSDARVWELASMTETDFATFLFLPLWVGRTQAAGAMAWGRLGLRHAPDGDLTPAVIKDWLPRVARHWFHHVDA